MIPLTKIEEKLIVEILEQFDFEKCKIVMDHLNWTWGFTNQVPTLQVLKDSARNRITRAIEGIRSEEKWSHHHPYMCSSGGLCAYVWKNRYGRICDIKLEFILTEWNACH
jgi:hypothetical protein